MNEAQLSEQWRKASLEYVTAVNAYVARGLSEGWKNIGPEPKDNRAHLAEDVLTAVRHANQTGNTGALRDMFPPAWGPFLSMIEQKGRGLAPMLWIDNDRIAVHVGATYEQARSSSLAMPSSNSRGCLASAGRPMERCLGSHSMMEFRCAAVGTDRRWLLCNGPLARRGFRLAMTSRAKSTSRTLASSPFFQTGSAPLSCCGKVCLL
jgi:hypothetical protein